MSFNTNCIYFNEFDYIAFFVKGLVNTETAVHLIEYAGAEMSKHECKRVFFDVSDTVSSATASANFDFANHLPELLKKGYDFKWVVYYQNDAHMYELISNISKQSGLESLLITPDKEMGLRWLLQDQEHQNL